MTTPEQAGLAIAERINAKVAEIIQKDLVDFYEILQRLSLDPTSENFRTAENLRKIVYHGVERRLISEGWTLREDMVECTVRGLRPPGEKS